MDDDVFKSFFQRFNKNKDSNPASLQKVQSLELKLGIHLPTGYYNFLTTYGDLWTPDILDLIDDLDLDLNDVQDFWNIDKIAVDVETGWTSGLEIKLFPFASDCMGNIFGFKFDDMKSKEPTCAVYFYDHDFNELERVSDSFEEWIAQYLQLNA